MLIMEFIFSYLFIFLYSVGCLYIQEHNTFIFFAEHFQINNFILNYSSHDNVFVDRF